MTTSCYLPKSSLNSEKLTTSQEALLLSPPSHGTHGMVPGKLTTSQEALLLSPPSHGTHGMVPGKLNLHQKILLHTLQYFSQYDFLDQNDLLFIIDHVDIILYYYEMIHNEYLLFLPKIQFYLMKKSPPCLISLFLPNSVSSHSTLKSELEAFHITVIPSEKIHEFNYFVQFINRFHKKHPYHPFIQEYISKVGEILFEENHQIKPYLISHYKAKEYYFYENSFLPNILYKKIQLSRIAQFISLEHYAYKRSEYMLRSFSQIAEELGAIQIRISHHYIQDDEKISKLGVINKSYIRRIGRKREKNELSFDFTYCDHNYINLNEFLLKNKILNENKFLLSKEDFDSNVELKYLISARCKNFIEKYYTQFKSSTLNHKELSIFFTLKEFDINLDHFNIISEQIETTLQIDFLNVLEHTSLIDGGNIFPLKEGYMYLKQMILEEKNYSIYINFLKAHLHAIQNQYAYLSYDYEYIEHVMKMYHQCIELNFCEKEWVEYIQSYWNENREWYHFTLLRDKILLGNDNINDKFHFVTFQYMNIFKHKYHMLKKCEEFLQSILEPLIDTYISYSMKKYNEEEEKGEKKNEEVNSEDADSEDEKIREQMKVKELVQYCDESIVDFIHQREERHVNVNLLDEIRNRIQGYFYLDDEEEEENQEKSDEKKSLIQLYFQYIQYIKNIHIHKGEEKSTFFSNHLFKEKLKKNQFQKKLIQLLIKGIKGSFYYENGISNNIHDIHSLQKVILNVIDYYFQDEVEHLQDLCLHYVYPIEKYKLIDVKLLIENCALTLSSFYIQRFHYKSKVKVEEKRRFLLPNLHDSIQPYQDDNHSPISMEKQARMSLMDEAKNIFVKFLWKSIDVKEYNESRLKEKIDSTFSVSYLLSNYRKYRLFYTYDDYKKIDDEIHGYKEEKKKEEKN